MIVFVIGSYSIFAFAGDNQTTRVYIYDENGSQRGVLVFMDEPIGATNFMVSANGQLSAFFPMEKLAVTLDILRHEKPVHFRAHQDHNWAAVTTGREPTGEEEGL